MPVEPKPVRTLVILGVLALVGAAALFASLDAMEGAIERRRARSAARQAS